VILRHTVSWANRSYLAHGRGIRIGIFAQLRYRPRRYQRGDYRAVIPAKDRSDLGYGKVNVLIDSSHSARLADFGLTIIIDELTDGPTVDHGPRGTIRWMAPEVLYPERFKFPGEFQKRLPSKSTDVYGLAMTILEGCMPAAERFLEY